MSNMTKSFRVYYREERPLPGPEIVPKTKKVADSVIVEAKNGTQAMEALLKAHPNREPYAAKKI
jgi:hypothetical protein